MDSKLLEYFLRVSELGSINKAAIDLHLSQPALSRHIAALEHELGTPLFTRSSGGVVLTDGGKLLCDRARPLLHQFGALKEQVAERAAGQVAIGIPPSWQHVVTARLVERVAAELPKVALRIQESVSHQLRDAMLAGLLDLCVLPFATAATSSYRQTVVVREPLVLIGDAKAELRADKPVTVDLLATRPLVLPARPNVLRAHVEHALARKELRLRLAAETDTLTLCMELARRGVGRTVVPASAVHTHRLGDSISWAPVCGLYISWVLCENEARTHSQAVREARRLMMTTVADALHDGAWFGAEASGPTG